MKSQNQWRIR